jgi:hypothetical protein
LRFFLLLLWRSVGELVSFIPDELLVIDSVTPPWDPDVPLCLAVPEPFCPAPIALPDCPVADPPERTRRLAEWQELPQFPVRS